MLHKSCLSGRLGAVGFTLIELLVVVLIIGILAAVALPQYQKAVERAKAAEAMTVLKTVARAMERAKLATGDYPDKFAELDVEIPWTGTVPGWTNPGGQDTRSNKDWSLQIYHAWSHSIIVTRLTGKYKGGRLEWFLSDYGNPTYKPYLACYETPAEQGVGFTGQPGDFCIKVMHGRQGAGTRDDFYTLDL